ncbi:hypothetical protein A1O7_02126 [Cladophialophora yegresii CBS 114405]|uniref:Uncharacterized protein n=1 Tax=Cladophialophora yegresii CBS 114405 TaxID=1182544 RepID=W9W0U3_9EURO|nr:uncharacterized protein A1O7_02126 [Cladophialophora yegresii CBS 114405]EXJ61697.1 hypothetical protein A1O7_02126 [Cladophialophora yegresii CBS 114405]
MSVNLTPNYRCSSIVKTRAVTKVNGATGANGCLSLHNPANNQTVTRKIIGSVRNTASTKLKKAIFALTWKRSIPSATTVKQVLLIYRNIASCGTIDAPYRSAMAANVNSTAPPASSSTSSR